jgi:hypothetical protein
LAQKVADAVVCRIPVVDPADLVAVGLEEQEEYVTQERCQPGRVGVWVHGAGGYGQVACVVAGAWLLKHGVRQ